MRGREAEERDLWEVEKEVKEEERRREEEERGATGGVARDRRAKAEPDRRAFMVWEIRQELGPMLGKASARLSLFLFGSEAVSGGQFCGFAV